MNNVRNICIAIFALVVIGLVSFFGWNWYQNWMISHYSYVIPNVPAYSIFDEETLNSFRLRPVSTFEGSVFAVLRYWGDPIQPGDTSLTKALGGYSSLSQNTDAIKKLRDYLDQRGFDLQIIKLKTPEALVQYINADRPIPLIFRQLMRKEDLSLSAYKVLVGLDMNKGTVLINDYIEGPMREVSLKDFRTLWDLHPYLLSRNSYYAIVPKDPAVIQKRIEENKRVQTYPSRTTVMDTIDPLLYDYAKSQFNQVNKNDRAKSLHNMISSPLFAQFHPAIQVWLRVQLAEFLIQDKAYAPALAEINAAIARDHDLDAPVKGWGTFHYKQVEGPYLSLSHYYLAIGDTKNADAAMTAARKIAADNFSK